MEKKGGLWSCRRHQLVRLWSSPLWCGETSPREDLGCGERPSDCSAGRVTNNCAGRGRGVDEGGSRGGSRTTRNPRNAAVKRRACYQTLLYVTGVCESSSQGEGSEHDGFCCSNQPANTRLITAFHCFPEWGGYMIKPWLIVIQSVTVQHAQRRQGEETSAEREEKINRQQQWGRREKDGW